LYFGNRYCCAFYYIFDFLGFSCEATQEMPMSVRECIHPPCPVSLFSLLNCSQDANDIDRPTKTNKTKTIKTKPTKRKLTKQKQTEQKQT
jgi:hypothetical protein